MSLVGFDLAYHGRRFPGWHRQHDGDASVQATLERAVQAALGAGTGAVRLNALTDVASAKGAHSRGQLCFFRATPAALALVASGERRPALPRHGDDPPAAIAGPLRALGGSWPRPSRLRVRYYFLQGQPAPELAPYAWYVKEPLDLAALRRAAGLLVGSRDLSALSRSKKKGGGGGGDAALTTIEWARVTQLPARASAFGLVGSSHDGAAASDPAGNGASWLLQLEIATAEGSGTLPRQLVQRLAALLRRLASPEAAEAERRMRAVLDGSSDEAGELAVAPARGLWLEEVGLHGSAAAISVESGSAAPEPPAKRAHCETGGADDDREDESSGVPVHTMSSRALLAPSTGACWVGPSKLGSQRLSTSDYAPLLEMQGGSEDGQPVVVGVNSAALPQFFAKVWPRVHADTRCVLVSGDSDWGIPGELWAKSPQLPPLRTVLEDSRLTAWFTQNYDFGFGCHHNLARSCHESDDPLLLGGPLLQKLRPLPIGLDFHSLSEKAAEGVVYRGMRATSAEHQQADLDAIAASLPPFFKRSVQAYGSRWRPLSTAAAAASPFRIDSSDDGDGGCPRAQALRVFSSALYTGHVAIETDELHRSESWRRHGRYAFVISPPGHGIDCHRTWEALALGSIPITLAPTGSPACWSNPLFSGLPVVVVRRWEEVTDEALHKWRAMHAASFDQATPQAYALTNALGLQHWRAECGGS